VVDFVSKILLLSIPEIKGKKTYLIPAQSLTNEMISFFSEDAFFNIFNVTDRAYIKEINNKPWNIFFYLYSKATGEIFGFIWVSIDNDLCLDITLHGGSWKKSIGMGSLYYDAWNTLLEYLKNHFKVIKTSCRSNNLGAIKFIETTRFRRLNKKNSEYLYFIFH
jgi:hypothetical protein